MSPPFPTPADQALMVAVLRQASVEKVDYAVLQHELGVPTKNAAQVRWYRLQAKLKQASSGATVVYTEADLTLMLAVLKQTAVGKLDFNVLQEELGVPTKNAAQVRWYRFQARLKTATGDAGASGAGTGPSSSPASKVKRPATPRKRKDRAGASESDGDDADTAETTPRKKVAASKGPFKAKVAKDASDDDEDAKSQDARDD